MAILNIKNKNKINYIKMGDNSKKDSRKVSNKKKVEQAKNLEQRIESLEDQLKRAVADYRNLEKRMEEERKETIKFANKELLMRIIPAFDTLFLAEKYVADEGVKLTVKVLQDALRDVGVERVAIEGQDYNPAVMEAVVTVEGEDNKVLEELRPGYTLYGKLIRPAQVKVGKQD